MFFDIFFFKRKKAWGAENRDEGDDRLDASLENSDNESELVE